MSELADATQGTFENRAGAATLDVRNDADATGIVLVGRMIEPLRWGHCVVEGEPRHGIATIRHDRIGARVGILLRGKAFRGIVEYGSCPFR